MSRHYRYQILVCSVIFYCINPVDADRPSLGPADEGHVSLAVRAKSFQLLEGDAVQEHSDMLASTHTEVQALQGRIEEAREHLQEIAAGQRARERLSSLKELHDKQAVHTENARLLSLEQNNWKQSPATDDRAAQTAHRHQPDFLLDEGHSSVAEETLEKVDKQARQKLDSKSSEPPEWISSATDPKEVIASHLVPLKAAIVAYAAINDGKCPEKSPVPIVQVDEEATYGVGCNFQGEKLCACPSATRQACDTELSPFDVTTSSSSGNSLTTPFIKEFGHCRAAAWTIFVPIGIFVAVLGGCCYFFCAC